MSPVMSNTYTPHYMQDTVERLIADPAELEQRIARGDEGAAAAYEGYKHQRAAKVADMKNVGCLQICSSLLTGCSMM